MTYIPWEKVKVDDLDGFAEGGIIDQETVNDGRHNTLHTSLFGKRSQETRLVKYKLLIYFQLHYLNN